MIVLRNFDVASYYPHLMTLYGYTSRNIPSPKTFSDVLDRRMKAKASGDKVTANALKLVVNTTYGASLNQYNDLYDPLMGRSVCITGQLFLLELAEHLHKDIPGLQIVQLNTDGIMISHDDSFTEAVNAIVNEWQARTGFELEEDSIKALLQKDVNNYIELQTNGKVKAKGGMLVRGVAPAGAFNVNNNAPIVAEALIKAFTEHKPIQDTVAECNDPLKFQLIAKASGKYSAVYQYHYDCNSGRYTNKTPTQRCNRVYAAKDASLGTLYKVHETTGNEEKIAGLPAHCLVDNSNKATINDIDKEWYISLARKQLDAFYGKEPPKPDGRLLLTHRRAINKIINI